jgi:MGT family glycosyltransferase
VFATDALVGSNLDVPPNTELVGPSIPGAGRLAPDFPWDRVKGDRPLVYISVGTMLSDPSLYEITAAAVASLGAQPIISAAGIDGADLDLPEDTIFVSAAPQHALLEKVQVFISHGGANSVAESMYYGVPLLVIPLGIDQPVQAHFVSTARAGLALRRDQLDVDACRNALAKLLAPSSEQRANAVRIGEAYRSTDGAARAAELVLRLVGAGAPTRRPYAA